MQVNGGTPITTTYNAANQITNAGFTYDNAGNLINDGSAAYTYDALNRTTVRGSTTYGYNGDGTLVSQATGGVTTRYTQDLASPLSQVLQTKVGAAAVVAHRRGATAGTLGVAYRASLPLHADHYANLALGDAHSRAGCVRQGSRQIGLGLT